jgi:hypothetical protein
MKNGGWLSKYNTPEAQNGIEGTMAGLTDKGFNYNGAWGGTMAMGGSLPGSVGFTYARTQDPAPSNGPYAKKTKASAQNGQEMKFYQEGLDWKPKTISRDGSSLPKAQTGRKLKYELDKPISTKQDATKVVPINKMTSEQAKKLQTQKDYQEILRRKEAIVLSQEARNKPLSIQNLADESGAIGDKYRIFPNDPNSFVDEYLNPGVQIGNMASALGRIPLNLQEGNYGQVAIAIGTPLAMGALVGIQSQNTGQFANNLLNPLAGISSIDSKALSRIKHTSQVQKFSNYDEIPFDINNLSQKDKSLIDLYSTESGPFHTDLEKIKQLDELINKTKGGEFPLIRHFSDNPTFKAGLREKDLLESSGELLSPRPLSFSAFEGLDDFGKNRMLLTKPENQSYLKIGNDFMEENEIVLPSNLKYKVNKKEPNKLGGIDYHVNFKQGGWLSKYEDGGIIEDDRGQLKYPGEITKINSNQITMQGVDYPVLGVSDTGDMQMMQPGQDYTYEGESVTEYPIMQKGGKIKKFLDQAKTSIITGGGNPFSTASNLVEPSVDLLASTLAPHETVKEREALFNKYRPVEYPNPVNIMRGILYPEEQGSPRRDIEGNYDIGEEAWRKALDLPVKENYIIPSQYKPTDAKNPKSKYYTLNNIIDSDKIITEAKKLGWKPGASYNVRSLAPFIKKGAVIDEEDFGNVDPLQQFQLDIDPEGKYASIYDKYDFKYSSLNKIIKPYEFYDRFYLPEKKISKGKKENGGWLSKYN